MSMEDPARSVTQKPATAARMYDYYLGGIHNFPADQAAAKTIISQFPCMPAVAKANRAFLGRAVRHLVEVGVRQFLDVGSGIPTVGNVHEIAQAAAPETRVVYVDIDPVAVAESLEILEGNELATAIRADLRSPMDVFEHPGVRRLLNVREPIALMLVSVMHFVPDDPQAHDVVSQFVSAVAPGSYLVLSHAATETFEPIYAQVKTKSDVYRRQTATPATTRTRAGVERFFTGVEVLDPGVVALHEWRPDPDEPAAPADDPDFGGRGSWAGVGRKP